MENPRFTTSFNPDQLSKLNDEDQELVKYMIEGTKLKIRMASHAKSQLKHLRSFHQRRVKVLARETGLPVICVKRFMERFKKGKS